jgi:DNA-binding response OmpR family regulator
MDPLKGKKILVVDDESDIGQSVVDMLPTCDVAVAMSYEAGRRMLATGRFDVAILDIMGVRGYDLLAEFSTKVPCVMLTAHALTPDDLKQSIAGKAMLYLPKQELARIEVYVREVLHAKEPLWRWLFARVNFSRFFGAGWAKGDDFFAKLELSDDEVKADLEAWERK